MKIAAVLPSRLRSSLVTRLFAINSRETLVTRRGFRVTDPLVRLRLEAIGEAFLTGYGSVLRRGEFTDEIDSSALGLSMQGFAWEGAAMAGALLEFSGAAKPRLIRSLRNPEHRHIHLLHVGVGWAVARWPFRPSAFLAELDPLFAMLVFDGHGFHAGYFGAGRTHSIRNPWGRNDPRRGPFDQGLGRSLWFTEGADPTRILNTIEQFAEDRRGSLWSGIGLAATYAGSGSDTPLADLVDRARKWAPYIAQGSAFGAKARTTDASATPETERACLALCGVGVAEAAALSDQARQEVAHVPEGERYEHWRRATRAPFDQRRHS